ncbi:MAG TPA: tetratricopeptide repeat protein, partial [Beijerinckiaceae bacterium]|nr:tetratricopeptide repeat protein [Beijerinckiaceae bacterium]
TTAAARPLAVSASPEGDYLAAFVASEDQDTLAAATFFREVLRSDPRNPKLLESTFAAALANGNMSEAFNLADRLLKQDPRNGLAHLAAGIRAIKAKQYPTARSELSQGTPSGQRDVTATLLTAWAYAGAGDEKRALAAMDKVNDPRFAVFRDYHAGLIAQLFDDMPEAGKRLKAAYAAEKSTLRVVDAYARFIDRQGDTDGAKKAYLDFNALLPNHPLVVAAIADIDAGRKLEPLVKSADAGAAEVLYGLGAIGSQANEDLASMIYLRLSLFLDPENSLALVTLADTYERQEQGERAIEIYQSVPEKSPLRENSQIQSALILDTLGKTDDATKRLQSIIAAQPKDTDALLALANLQRSHKQFEDATATYTKVLDQATPGNKTDWSTYYFRGIGEERSNHWPAAEADFKKGLELSPDQPLVLNYLGYSWVDKGINLDDAFKMLNRAVDLRPTDGYIVDSLGWAYFKLGEYDQAVNELEKAIDLKPGDSTINDHLGDAYWMVGRKLEAHWQWNHARDMEPDPEDLPKILDKIAHGLPEPAGKPAAAADPAKSAPPAAAAPEKSGG